MARSYKYPDEVVAALLYHFTPYSVERMTGARPSRYKSIVPTHNDDLIDEFLDSPHLRRRRLEWSEMMDILVLRERGYSDREIQSALSFSTHNHGTLDELIERIQTQGYSIPEKDRDTYGA